MAITIKDIARESGYAVSTVSRALNNQPDVSVEAKKHIQEIVAQHGFVPNDNARRLKQQQSKSIAIVVQGAFNAFFAPVLECIQSEIAAAGYTATVKTLTEMDNEVNAALRLCRERKPLGVIFLGGNIHTFEAEFAQISLPCVLATAGSGTLQFENLSVVTIDDTEAMRRGTEFLLNSGHRHIGVIGGKIPGNYISELRYKGLVSAMQKAGIAFDDKYYEDAAFTSEGGYRAMQTLLTRCRDITAVQCMSDTTAMGAIRAVYDAGLRVPEDISVLGFDGIAVCSYIVPRLSTLCQPAAEIARKSVACLLAQINGGSAEPSVLLPVTLQDGESVCAPQSKQ